MPCPVMEQSKAKPRLGESGFTFLLMRLQRNNPRSGTFRREAELPTHQGLPEALWRVQGAAQTGRGDLWAQGYLPLAKTESRW